MKRLLILSFIILSLVTGVNAQEDPLIKEQRIEALKIAFISQKLELTAAEAEKFWPVYYKYESEMKQVHKESATTDVLDKDEKLLNIRKKYKTEFSNVLGAKRVNNLYKSEHDFRSVLLRHIQHPSFQRPAPILPSSKPLIHSKR